MTRAESERKIEVGDIRVVLYDELSELIKKNKDKNLIYVEGVKLLDLFKHIGVLLDNEYDDIKNLLFKLVQGKRSKSDTIKIIDVILFLFSDFSDYIEAIEN